MGGGGVSPRVCTGRSEVSISLSYSLSTLFLVSHWAWNPLPVWLEWLPASPRALLTALYQHWDCSACCIYVELVHSGAGSQTQVFLLAHRALYQLSHLSSPGRFICVYLWIRKLIVYFPIVTNPDTSRISEVGRKGFPYLFIPQGYLLHAKGQLKLG